MFFCNSEVPPGLQAELLTVGSCCIHQWGTHLQTVSHELPATAGTQEESRGQHLHCCAAKGVQIFSPVLRVWAHQSRGCHYLLHARSSGPCTGGCSAWPRTNKEQNDSDWEQPAFGANHIAARCQQRASAARHAACELLLQPLCLPSHQEQLSLTLSHYSSGSALPMFFFKQTGWGFLCLFVVIFTFFWRKEKEEGKNNPQLQSLGQGSTLIIGVRAGSVLSSSQVQREVDALMLSCAAVNKIRDTSVPGLEASGSLCD